MIMKLSLNDLRAVTGELKVFYSSFSDFFRNRTRSVLKQAFQYLQGQIMVNERVNMTNIEKVVPDCNHQSPFSYPIHPLNIHSYHHLLYRGLIVK